MVISAVGQPPGGATTFAFIGARNWNETLGLGIVLMIISLVILLSTMIVKLDEYFLIGSAKKTNDYLKYVQENPEFIREQARAFDVTEKQATLLFADYFQKSNIANPEDAFDQEDVRKIAHDKVAVELELLADKNITRINKFGMTKEQTLRAIKAHRVKRLPLSGRFALSAKDQLANALSAASVPGQSALFVLETSLAALRGLLGGATKLGGG